MICNLQQNRYTVSTQVVTFIYYYTPMNKVELVEWWKYCMNLMGTFTDELLVIKKVKIKNWFTYVDAIVYMEWKLKRIMTIADFNKIVLYKLD